MLNVRDLPAERAFYERLGLPVIYEGPEYPDFIGFGTGAVHFGIQKADGDNDPPSVLTWQIAVADIDAAIQQCRSLVSASTSKTTTLLRVDLPAPAHPHSQRLPASTRRPQRITLSRAASPR